MGHALPFMSNQYYILQMSHWANGRAAAALALQTALAEGKIPEPPCRPSHRKPRPTSVLLLESLCHIQPHLLFTTIKKDHMIHKKKETVLVRTALPTPWDSHTSAMPQAAFRI